MRATALKSVARKLKLPYAFIPFWSAFVVGGWNSQGIGLRPFGSFMLLVVPTTCGIMYDYVSHRRGLENKIGTQESFQPLRSFVTYSLETIVGYGLGYMVDYLTKKGGV